MFSIRSVTAPCNILQKDISSNLKRSSTYSSQEKVNIQFQGVSSIDIASFAKASKEKLSTKWHNTIVWINNPEGIVAQVIFPLVKLTALVALITLIVMSTPVPIQQQLAILGLIVLINIIFSFEVARANPVETEDAISYRGTFHKSVNFVLSHLDPSGVPAAPGKAAETVIRKIPKR